MFPFLIGQLVLQAVGGVNSNQLDYDKRMNELFSMKNVDVSKPIDSILSYNWTENLECLIELNKIKEGLTNNQKWAMRRK